MCPRPFFGSSELQANVLSIFSRDAYVGMVIGATCNCIPGGQEGEAPSAFLNCHGYQLNEEQGPINTTNLARGQCDFEMFEMFLLSTCSELGTMLSGTAHVMG